MLLRFIFCTICFHSSNAYGQQYFEKGPYLKIYISNTDPILNEIVTLKAECTAPNDLENASIYFDIYIDGAEYEDSSKVIEATELINGQRIWRGEMKGGETVSKEISIRFKQRNVFQCYVGFVFAKGHTSLSKLIKIYVGGAFEEDQRVRKLKDAIIWYEQELIKPHTNPFKPDTSTFVHSDENDFHKQFGHNILQKFKTDSRLDDSENMRKNDSLLIQLRKEYQQLMKQVEEKKRQQIRSNN